jgi:hypothetical protein
MRILARKGRGETGVGDVRACMHVLDQTGRIEIVACVATCTRLTNIPLQMLFLGANDPTLLGGILEFAPFWRDMCGGISRRAECVREAMLHMQPPSLCNNDEHE